MAILRNCCCCISLRSGGVVMGTLTLIGAMILLSVASITMYHTTQLHPHANNATQNGGQQHDDLSIIVSLFIQGIFIISGVFAVICSLMLIYGALNRRRGFLIPYMVCGGFRVVYLTFRCMQTIYSICAVPHDSADPDLRAASLVSLVFSLALEFYFFLCVYSLFQECREQQQMQRMQQNARQSPYNPHMQVAYSPVKA